MTTNAAQEARPKPPAVTLAAVWVATARRCVVCGDWAVHTHHIDGNPANNDAKNLAPVCFEHHDAATRTGGLKKKISPTEMRAHKKDWEKKVKDGTIPPLAPAGPDVKSKVEQVMRLLFALVESLSRGAAEAVEADDMVSHTYDEMAAGLSVEKGGPDLVQAITALKTAVKAYAFHSISYENILKQNPDKAADFATRLEGYRDQAEAKAVEVYNKAQAVLVQGSPGGRDPKASAAAIRAELGETEHVLGLMLDNAAPLQVPVSRAVFDALLPQLTEDVPPDVLASVVKAYGHMDVIADSVAAAQNSGTVSAALVTVMTLRLEDLTSAVTQLTAFIAEGQ
jgi:hypothetical protein